MASEDSIRESPHASLADSILEFRQVWVMPYLSIPGYQEEEEAVVRVKPYVSFTRSGESINESPT